MTTDRSKWRRMTADEVASLGLTTSDASVTMWTDGDRIYLEQRLAAPPKMTFTWTR